MQIKNLKQISEYAWRIDPHGKMRVPIIIYASFELIKEMDDKVHEQAANVATLPGIVDACYVMPDAHWVLRALFSCLTSSLNLFCLELSITPVSFFTAPAYISDFDVKKGLVKGKKGFFGVKKRAL